MAPSNIPFRSLGSTLETISQPIREEEEEDDNDDSDDKDDNDDDDDTRVSLPGLLVSSSTNVDVSLSFPSAIEDEDELVGWLRQRYGRY
jgi:hypothetical protein